MQLLSIVGRGTPAGATRYNVTHVSAFTLGQKMRHENNTVVVTKIDKDNNTVDVIPVDLWDRINSAQSVTPSTDTTEE